MFHLYSVSQVKKTLCNTICNYIELHKCYNNNRTILACHTLWATTIPTYPLRLSFCAQGSLYREGRLWADGRLLKTRLYLDLHDAVCYIYIPVKFEIFVGDFGVVSESSEHVIGATNRPNGVQNCFAGNQGIFALQSEEMRSVQGRKYSSFLRSETKTVYTENV